MSNSLRESQSLDRASRPRRRSTPSSTVTFRGPPKAGTTSLIHRLAYDRWRKGDNTTHSLPDPMFFRVEDRLDILLEDVSQLEAAYTAMRHSTSNTSLVRISVFALDDPQLDTHLGDALGRVREEDEMLSTASLHHLAQRSVFVFTKSDIESARGANLWKCQRALSQAGGMMLSVDDTMHGTLVARLLYIDCSALTGKNVELVRGFLRRMALDAHETVRSNDLSPRYVRSSRSVEPESTGAVTNVRSFRDERGGSGGCLLV